MCKVENANDENARHENTGKKNSFKNQLGLPCRVGLALKPAFANRQTGFISSGVQTIASQISIPGHSPHP